MKIAVILPSRGLIFSQTADEILQNVKQTPHKFFFSHRKPIPQCFEDPTLRALADPEITHLWFVEDDMVLPPNVLAELLKADRDVVTCDYPVLKTGQGSVFRDAGAEVLFCGTGCLLVKRRVFEKIKPPYFRSDISWQVLNYGTALKFIANLNGRSDVYGLHDVTFGIKLYKANINIHVSKTKLSQRKLIALGTPGSNNGAHHIEVWSRIKKNMLLKQLQSYPVSPGASSKLVTVDTPTGGVNTTKKHAENLVEQGLATYPPKRCSIIDDSEVEI